MPIGPVMIDIIGWELTEAERKLLQNPLIGGVILFSRNFRDVKQLQHLVYSIRHAKKSQLLIAVDQEGGLVQRFKTGFTQLPSNSQLGKLYDEDSEKALEYARSIGWLMASEILSIGIDLSFAPVLDINNVNSLVINGRGFHSDHEKLVEIANAYIEGMNSAGMACTGKHFPGHGYVNDDSHLNLPVDDRAMIEIDARDLLPFSTLSYNLDAIMSAHILFPKIDDLPASLSKFWLQDILRKELYFSGAIFSDDLSMQALKDYGDYVQRAQMALKAGSDMILVCNNPEVIPSVLEALKDYKNTVSEQRLLKLSGHFQLTREELLRTVEWRCASNKANELI